MIGFAMLATCDGRSSLADSFTVQDPELIHRGKATRYLETTILFMEEIRRSPPGMYKNSVKNGIFAIATG